VQLEGAAEAVWREALSFWAILQVPSEAITFSYPAMLEDKEMLPSSYFSSLALKPETPPDFPVASLEEKRKIRILWDDSDETGIRHAFDIENARIQGDMPEEYQGNIGVSIDPGDRLFSPSQFNTIGQCPFRWLGQKLFHLDEPEEMEESLAPNQKGELYHKTIELALKKTEDRSDRRAAILEVLEESWGEAEKEVEIPRLPGWSFRRREFLKQLRAAIEAEKFIRDDAEVIAIERSFRGEWNGFKVTGMVDRVDRTPDGLVLIDYKTSGSPPKGAKDLTGDLKLDIQIPLYAEVAAPCFDPNQPISEAYYYSVTKGAPLKVEPSVPEDLEAFAERVKSYLQEGYYPISPDSQRKACDYCVFDELCRLDGEEREE
jgi:RecB family exonuclease